VCAFLFFYGLHLFGLVGADEPRYAQVAREMFERNDWVTPTLGGQAWLEKPVLYYWEARLAYSLFGVTDWAARLPGAASAMLMVAAIYTVLRRLRPFAALDAALMTASCAAVVGFSHGASTDMLLAANLTIGLLCWYVFFESRQRRWLLAAYVFLGLATLAKGPVAIALAALPLLGFAVIRRRAGLLWTTLWLPGVALFVAVTLPWYVLVQLRNPEFFRVFILEHNLARYGTDLYRHTQPIWYYIPVAALCLMPWLVPVVQSVSGTIREWWRQDRSDLDGVDQLDQFLLLWLLLPVAFFSLSQSKLPGYILPAIPAASLLAANRIGRRTEAPSARLSLIVTHCLGVAAMPAALVFQLSVMRGAPTGTTAAAALGLGAALTLALVLVLRWKPGWAPLRFVTLVVTLLSLAAVLRFGASALDDTQSTRPLAMALGHADTRRLPVAVLQAPRDVEYGLAFYRNQVISRYERGEVPLVEHLLVVPGGAPADLAPFVGERRTSRLGSFVPRRLDYYRVEGVRPAP